MQKAARILTLFLLMTVTAGLLTACADGPLRRRMMQTQAAATASTGQTPAPSATTGIEQPAETETEVESTATMEQPTLEPQVPTETTAVQQPTVVDDTTGQNLESLLDQLSTANAGGDGLEDVE